MSSTDITAWTSEGKEHDERVCEQQEIVQEQILANNTACEEYGT
jgi:hypothetical protein